MKFLLITEKCSQNEHELDGGARLVETLRNALGSSLSIMQFGSTAEKSATWHFAYPIYLPNRFERRVANANFIAAQVQAVEAKFTHLLFVHVSMQFGFANHFFRNDLEVWTFPMFLTPSYQASGENVPTQYMDIERQTLQQTKNILTPSYLEKKQLIDLYHIPNEKIQVVPRGINLRWLEPKYRFLQGPLRFCSIGSIKPQKNTLGLIQLFAKIQNKFPGAVLQLIGPIQNNSYFEEVYQEIDRLHLTEWVKFIGFLSPSMLSVATASDHFHLSMSHCETFGRSIFETLALGMPNIAKRCENAAAERLQNLPYARFVDEESEALEAIEEMLVNYPRLSSMAHEIGHLYDDQILSSLLLAKLCNQTLLAVSDYDGTLYHKDDAEKTERCIEAFQKFSVRILCSARSLEYLLNHMQENRLEVDWIVGLSGAIVANGSGQVLWTVPLNFSDIVCIESQIQSPIRIERGGEVLQIATSIGSLPSLLGFRVEKYQERAFISHWQASKLHAIHRLLRYISWTGQVRVFGDGPYDQELLTYFDGTWIAPSPTNHSQKKEIEYA